MRHRPNDATPREKLPDRSASCDASCLNPSSTRTFGNSTGFPIELGSPYCRRRRLITEAKVSLMESFLIDRYKKGKVVVIVNGARGQ
ncbi:hypothetical protein MESS2_1250016 [Mesorhizobium metallidurans STM 2683]|uniref:Uncharacterized protein n=1 Tax=Mesorhizobium metallidurans STM 2683 TaxID=1297569 RepID=M5EXC0_9HYPH|nr:hypothetical protein MESS2_1250016 [Mesorhizobium metallidurans STM 2683]